MLQNTKADKLNSIISEPMDLRIVSKLEKGWGDPIDYISGTSMLVLLKEAFGPYYSMEFSEPRIVQYRKTPSKKNGEYIPSEVVEVKCTLTVPMKDPETGETVIVKREGFGSAVMKERFEEMVLKTAQTDAMKKAAYSFGLALELATHGKSENNKKEASWYNEAVFGMWSQEGMQKYTKEWNIIVAYMKKHNIGNDYNVVAKHFLNDYNAKLTSCNIKTVAEAIIKEEKNLAKESNEEQ